MQRVLWWLAIPGACAVAASVPLAAAAVSGRTREPTERLSAAAAALERARPIASIWARDELATAENLHRAAETARRTQAVTLYPWRDFGPVAAAAWEVERAAWRAEWAAAERRAEARADAEDVLADAIDLFGHAEELSRTMALPAQTRARLSWAGLALRESRLLFDDERYAPASERAAAARASLFAALGGVLENARRYTAGEQLETWRRWIDQTFAWSRSSGRTAAIVYKEKNQLLLLQAGRSVASYAADVGANGIGRKLRQGDRATPEGRYRVLSKKGPGESRFYKALLLDYPTAEDRRRLAEARRAGRLPANAQPGGLIEVHGEGGRGRNWTDGCVALSNADMDALYGRLDVGSWVTIVGGDGRDGAFSRLVSRLEAQEETP